MTILAVVLPSGEVKEQKDVKINDVRNALPMFVELAVGYENGWYVQTTDTHEETYLSCAIVEGLETKEQALEIAQNISDITGINIQVWND